MGAPTRIHADIARWQAVRAILRSPLFPVVFQTLVLAGAVGFAVNGFGVGSGMTAQDLLTLRKTNLTTLVVWGLWWPSMIAVALAFGRVWCTVCPLELVNRVGDSLARRIGWRRAPLGRFLRNGWMVVGAYLVLQLLVAGAAMHRVPHLTGWLLVTLGGVAFLTGIVLREPRSFCKSFCPASALLSVYGRYTPLQLDVRDPQTCQSCKTKDCIREGNRHRFDKRSCPSLLAPYRLEFSANCVLCFQCVKVCPQENMGFGIVRRNALDQRETMLRPFEAAFVMFALGFVAHEVIGEVKWLDGYFHAVPAWLNRIAPSVPFGWFEALWFLVVFPILVWTLVAAASYAMRYRGSLRALLLASATGAAPVVAAAHLAKAVAKVAAWGGFLPTALRDPRGVESLQRIADGTLASPAKLLDIPVIGAAMLILTGIMAWRSWHVSRRLEPESAPAVQIGLVGSAAVFSAVLAVWVISPA